jgi:hypothetical protein
VGSHMFGTAWRSLRDTRVPRSRRWRGLGSGCWSCRLLECPTGAG